MKPSNSSPPKYNLIDADSLVRAWEACPFAAEYTEIDESRRSEQHAFLHNFISQTHRFDCLVIGGWQPNENKLSDVIAAIFDPTWGHGLADSALDALLRLIANKNPTIRNPIETIMSVDESRRKVTVVRERWGGKSRSDIEICGVDFLICIEHKLRGNPETDIDGQSQTARLLEDVKKKGERLNIRDDRIFCVLLSPEGKEGECREFVAISFEELALALETSIGALQGPAAASIRGFMTYYGRNL